MVRQTFEGTWEQITREHGAELVGRRVRLVILEPEANGNLPESNGQPTGQTLDVMLKDYVGLVASDPPKNLSQRVDEAFAEAMKEKRAKWGQSQ